MTTVHKSKNVRFHMREVFTSTGIVGEDPFTLNGESELRIVVKGVGLSNVLKVQAKLSNDTDYIDIATITSTTNQVIDIATYDDVRFNVITYGGSQGELIVSGFYTSGVSEPLEVQGAVTGSFTPTGLTQGGIVTSMSIDDTAWVAAPSSVLLNRNSLSIQNISGNGGTVLWNYTASAAATVGWRIEDGGFKSVAVRDTIIVYVRMLSGSGKVIIDEVA